MTASVQQAEDVAVQLDPRPTRRRASRTASLRLLFLHEGLDEILGSERCLIDLVAGLVERGHACRVVCTSPTLLRAIVGVGGEATLVPGWPESASRRLPSMRIAARMLRIVDGMHPDVVHFNSVAPIKATLPATWLRGIPSVQHVHIVPVDRADRWYAWAPLCHAIVGVSEFAIAGYRDDGIAATRLHLIMNAVDPARLDPAAARDAGWPALPADAVVACVLGSLIERKRPMDAIEAFDLVAARHPSLHLVFIGGGALASALGDRAARSPWARRIHLLGSRPDGAALLARHAQLMVAPSGWEAMPLNVLEAQYAGLAIVASDIPPHREAIVDGRTGYLYRCGAITELASALDSVLSSPSDAATVAATARAHARDHYTMSRYVDEFEQLYTTLATSHESRRLPALRDLRVAALGR